MRHLQLAVAAALLAVSLWCVFAGETSTGGRVIAYALIGSIFALTGSGFLNAWLKRPRRTK